MAKKKFDIWKAVKRGLMLAALVSVISGGLTFCVTYFAKTSTVTGITTNVEMLGQRIGLSISQDNIDRKKSDLRWMKQQTAFVRKEEPRTVAEDEILKEVEEDLAETKSRHDDRVKQYEEKYNEKAQL